jgi:hypothetical protein
MSTRQYRNIPVKKEMLENLTILEPGKTLRVLVAEAIDEYIHNRNLRATNKTSDVCVGFLNINPTPETYTLTNQYTPNP